MMKKLSLFLVVMLFGFLANAYSQTAVGPAGNSSKELRSGKTLKNVVLEEVTGTWCQWCPRGTYTADSLSAAYDNVFVIAVHGGSDPMKYVVHQAATGLGSYPSANIDRKYIGKGTDDWFSTVNTAMAETPVAAITLSNNYNPANRSLVVTVSATFDQSVSGDYRLAALIVEDAVTGSTSSYNQANQYAGGTYGFMGGFETLPANIPFKMIAYDHVSRQLLGDYGGQANSLPNSIAAGSTHSYNFSASIPESWNPDYVRVLAWLIKPNGQIDNAGKSGYLNGGTNAKPKFLTNPTVVASVGNAYVYEVYTHDTDNRGLEITAVQLPGWLSLSETGSLGFIHNKATLSGTPNAPGTYQVVLSTTDGQNTSTQTFSIEVEGEAAGSWELVGNAGFTDGAGTIMDVGVSPDGTVYMIGTIADKLQVYKKSAGSSNWETTNLDQNTGSSGQLEIASDGTAYIAYVYDWSAIIVKKYENGQWVAVGTVPTQGPQVSLVIDKNDLPVIAVEDATINYGGTAYRYNGSSWDMIGGVPFITGEIAAWPQIRVDAEDNIYILWGAFTYSGTPAMVSKYDGNSWSIVGNGPVGEADVYYYQTFDLDNNGNIYVAYPAGTEAKKLVVYKFNGTSWVNIGNDVVNGSVQYCDMKVAANGKVMITFADETYNSTVSVVSWDGNQWEYVGPRGFTNTSANYPRIAIDENTPYVVYSDTPLSGKATAKAYIEPLFEPIILIEPMELAFDTTAVNANSVKSLVIKNQGNATLTVSSISSGNPVFSVNANSFTLAPGTSKTVAVTFAPQDEQWYEALITVLSNDSNAASIEIPVSGYGKIYTGLADHKMLMPEIYPNPATGQVQIRSSEPLQRVQLMTYAGQLIYEWEGRNNTHQLSVQDYKAGLYLIKTFTEKHINTQKLIIR